ncbi:hypothetical protein [Sulfurospirillum arsenophilum]|uniref:hypothetical protein n=1 Tax=Sulfurospirillum arsenophilum TaxID=56698 RepID=UPI000694C834|nr:hypothetical protein [Sulfurospirillum arsenophilum]
MTKNKKRRNKKNSRPKKLQSFLLDFIHCTNYKGNIPIYQKEWHRDNDYFWFEFSIKPTPISEEYRILFIEFIGYNPYIYLLYPMFPKTGSKRYPVPHIYNHKTQRLCLTFPDYNEWQSSKTLPDTYIPWTILWLYYYEEWLYSGEWKGGGLEPNDPEVLEIREKEAKNSNSEIDSKTKNTVIKKAEKICLARRKINIERLKNV